MDEAPPMALININTTDLDTLRELPGIGPTKAQAIVDYRANMLFERVDKLLKVMGIGQATLNKIKPLVTVCD